MPSAGVKIVAPDLEGALAGAPLFAVPEGEDVSKYCKLITEEIGRIRITKEIDGVIVKADTLGSLEAMAEILESQQRPSPHCRHRRHKQTRRD